MIPEIGQGTIIKPYQKPHPPIVVTAVAPHSKGVTEAAKRGWTPISANFLLPEWVASHWPKYQEGCIAIGKKPDPARLARREVDLRRRRRQGRASATATRPKGPYHFYFKQLIRKLVGVGGRGNLFKLDQNQPDSEITRRLRDAEAGDRRHREQRGRPDPRVPRKDRRLRHAATIPATTGSTRRSASARCS